VRAKARRADPQLQNLSAERRHAGADSASVWTDNPPAIKPKASDSFSAGAARAFSPNPAFQSLPKMW